MSYYQTGGELIQEADSQLPKLITHLVNINHINRQEAQVLGRMYEQNRMSFDNYLNDKFRYQSTIKDTEIKPELTNFILHLIAQIRKDSRNYNYSSGLDSYNSGLHQQQVNYQQPNRMITRTVSMYDDIDNVQQEPTIQRTPTMQTNTQPVNEVKQEPNVTTETELFIPATVIGTPQLINVEGYLSGKTKSVKADINKFTVGNYMLHRGYNDYDEAITALKNEVNMDTKYINFIRFNKLTVLNIPLEETNKIITPIQSFMNNDNLNVVNKVIETLELVSAKYSRIFSQFLVDRLNIYMAYLTSNNFISTEIILNSLQDLLQFITDSNDKFIDNLKAISNYDVTLSNIIKQGIVNIINGTLICDPDDDYEAHGDILHAKDNQCRVDRYINRDLNHLFITREAKENDSVNTPDPLSMLSEKLLEKTVIYMPQMIINTNMFPPKYRLMSDNNGNYETNINYRLVTDIVNHIDQFMDEIIKVDPLLNVTLVITPNKDRVITYNVIKTLQGNIRINRIK